MVQQIRIGNILIKKTAALAPMAGVTDTAFRELCKEFGASYVVGEMTSAKGLCYGDKKTQKLLRVSDYERPMAVQLFGDEVECLVKAAKICLKYKPDVIDINMGCPVRKITSNNSGSALMKNPKIISEIVSGVVKAVNIPVTVKIRKGWDEDNVNAVEVAKIIEDGGASAITIHGRTRQQMYSLKSDLDIIRQVKNSVNIPVIGNGDIIDVNDAIKMYKYTGCDLIMVGRGALGNPWIFKQIHEYFSTGKVIQEPSIEEKIDIMKKHMQLMIKYSSEEIAMKEAKKHIIWYIKGIKNAAMIRNEISTIKTFDQLYEIFKKIGI